MNLADLIAAYRSDAVDNALPYLASDSDLTIWFAEAQEEACIRARLIYDTSTLAICKVQVTAGTRSYPLHAAVFEIAFATLTDGNGEVSKLDQMDRVELTRISPDWRLKTERPKFLIHDDTRIELAFTPDQDYELTIEAYRLPLQPIANGLEIAGAHHRRLVDWALYRAYSRPDADLQDAEKAGNALANFEAYFGLRPDVDLRKATQANGPHFNKSAWL